MHRDGPDFELFVNAAISNFARVVHNSRDVS